ncbi:MAG TPA: helix-turn-helix transcriptional regulator [Thermoanaerobaculia bacterium]|jgi:transcriptional regulator with XRE-family HTH domain|nr:helix-turn-helix transcriptional regulator [Thermoanaerobaculia bacterium]
MTPDQAEVQRLLDILRTLMRMLAVSNREAERRLGLKHTAVTRVFGGKIEAKLEMILGIARVIGLEYDEFFDFAYPERRAAGAESAAARRIRTLLEDLHPSGFRAAQSAEEKPAPPPAPVMTQADREEMLRDLRKVVREVLGEVGAGSEGSPKPEKNGD